MAPRGSRGRARGDRGLRSQLRGRKTSRANQDGTTTVGSDLSLELNVSMVCTVRQRRSAACPAQRAAVPAADRERRWLRAEGRTRGSFA